MKVGDIVYHVAAAGDSDQPPHVKSPPVGHGLIVEEHPADLNGDVEYEVLWSEAGEVGRHCDYEIRTVEWATEDYELGGWPAVAQYKLSLATNNK